MSDPKLRKKKSTRKVIKEDSVRPRFFIVAELDQEM